MGQGKYSLSGPTQSGKYSQAAPAATTELAPVTLGDMMNNPREAIQRVGAILKQDVTDPSNWLTLATAYFGPKMLPKVSAVVKSAASRVNVSPKVAMDEFSIMQPQKMLKAVSLKEQPVEARVPGFSRYSAEHAPAAMPRLPERKSTIRAVENIRPPSAPLISLTPSESKAVFELKRKGMSEPEAIALVRNRGAK